MPIANTPEAPYYAVIFTSIRENSDREYDVTTKRMVELVEKQAGF